MYPDNAKLFPGMLVTLPRYGEGIIVGETFCDDYGVYYAPVRFLNSGTIMMCPESEITLTDVKKSTKLLEKPFSCPICNVTIISKSIRCFNPSCHLKISE